MSVESTRRGMIGDMAMPTVTRGDLDDAVTHAGLTGRAVCVHSSLSSFGRVDGGAATVVDAFLDAGCTLLVPTFSWDAFAVTPAPRSMRPHRNGTDYSWELKRDSGRAFTPASMEIDRDIGAIPRDVLGRRIGLRGNHPLCSFTAVGPLASRLVAGQTSEDVNAPLRALADAGGARVVLLGVSLTSMTLLHVAEQHAGRAMFVRWARDGRGVTKVRAGGCSRGFDQLAPALASVERTTAVGRSRWRVFPARDALALATEAIARNPQITRCHVPDCERCIDAINGGPPPPVTLR
jgi:aminoglycoside 3-N-acetyltransferase